MPTTKLRTPARFRVSSAVSRAATLRRVICHSPWFQVPQDGARARADRPRSQMHSRPWRGKTPTDAVAASSAIVAAVAAGGPGVLRSRE